MPILFDQPRLLWLLLLAVPIVWLGVRSLAALEPGRRWTAIGVRLLVLGLLVVILAGPRGQRWHEDVTVVAVVDQSESIRRFAKPPGVGRGTGSAGEGEPVDLDAPVTIDDWLQDWVRRASRDHEQNDRLGVVTYDGQPAVKALPSGDFDLPAGTVGQPAGGTDTATAIRLGLALFPPDSGKRLVLVSDGNDTASQDGADLLAAAKEARAAGIPVDVLPIDYRVEREVLVEGVYAPSESREGQSAGVRAVLRATSPARGLLFLKHDGEVVDLNGPGDGKAIIVLEHEWTVEQLTDDEGSDAAGVAGAAAADGEGGDAPGAVGEGAAGGMYVWMRKIDVPLVLAGTNRFEIIFEPAKGFDAMAGNNRAEAFTLVHGKGRVLFVDHLGAPSGSILPAALAEHGIELDVVASSGLPRRLARLQRYDAVILQNVPAEMVSTKQQSMLAEYVNDLGGGLIVIGGPDSFAAGGWTNSPVDRVLPVSCQLPTQTILPAGALVLVLDRSGSMGSPVSGSPYSQQEIANEAAVLALATLYPQDLVGVVAFDNSAKWVVPLGLNSDPSAIAQRIRSIHPGGGTSIYPGLKEAYDALAPLSPRDAAVKHVILLTDGQSQSAKYYRVVGDMVRSGITLSTVGVGDGVNDGLLGQLAQMSGGNYYKITDPNDLPQIFIKEARTIRKNVIKEQSFVPTVVVSGSSIVTGMGAIPPLEGFVLTGRKDGAFTPLLGPEEEPIFAHWQVGLGRSAAFTSDATNRWATAWLKWGGYADFWARTVRAIARPSASRDFDLLASIENDVLRVRLDAVSEEAAGSRRGGGGSFVNFMRVVGTVLGPDGKTHKVTLDQTGPGVYEARLPADEPGNYVVSLFVDEPGRGGGQGGDQRRVIFGGTSRPPGDELRRFTSNRARLEQIAAITGGRVLDPTRVDPDTLFNRRSIAASRSVRPLWRPLMVWLLVAFLIDVAVRRIAWDVAAMRGWVGDRLRIVGQLMKPRQVEAAATLEALKKRASQVEERLSSGRDDVESSVEAGSSLSSPVVTDRKFEAGPEAGPIASGGFSQAFGGAGVKEDQTEKPPAPAAQTPAKDVDPQAGTTQRLLDAKRRARERMDTGGASDDTGD